MGSAWIFAGQGAEEAGMGLALAATNAEARAWLDEASRVTGIDVPRALERGARALERTDVLQPVLVAVGLACVSARDDLPDRVAGHSLGELTAACWAASLPMRDALELAAARGRMMAAAANAHPGGMVAVSGSDEAELQAAIGRGREHGELCIAARNSEDEVVISGDRDALRWLSGELPRRCTTLRVAGAWHSERMRPAVAPFLEMLRAAFDGRSLRVPLVSACRVGEVSIEACANVLSDGLVRPVHFLEAVRHMEGAGIERAVLPEPSRTTRSLLRRASSRPWTVEIA